MRRAPVVILGTALALFLLAGTAFATYVKIINLDMSHKRQGQNRKLVLNGKVVLDPSRNPPKIPPGGENCPKNTAVKAQRRESGHWVDKSTAQSNGEGKVEIEVSDREGRWRLFVPSHLSGEKQCFPGKSKPKRHSH